MSAHDDADPFERAEHDIENLTRERDDARAKLAALETQSHADADRWIGERNEARAIARRLAVVARLALGDAVAGDMAHAYGEDVADDCMDILRTFDALPWAKDDAQP